MLFFVFIILFKNAESQTYHCPYFPLEYGKEWHYEAITLTYTDTLVVSVVDTATINGEFYFCYAPYGPRASWPRYWLRPEPWQIYALNMSDSSEYLLFDFKAEINTNWYIPPDSSQYNVPVNQCDWGSIVQLMSKNDTVYNQNRLLANTTLFSHYQRPCYDAGIASTNFYKDIGIVFFAQITEGDVMDYHLIIDKEDTLSTLGKYTIVGNPCLTVPCIPGVVSAVSIKNTNYVLSQNDSWFWNGEFSWNDYIPHMYDSVEVSGIITERKDVLGKTYYTFELIEFAKYNPVFIENIDEILLPERDCLIGNYPNPFNPSTVIQYSIANPGMVTLNVYDVNGRIVTNLIRQKQSRGQYKFQFDARDLPSGIYFYCLATAESVQTRKMILIR